MMASQYGHVEVVDKLLKHGAIVDLQEKVCFINFAWNVMLLHLTTDRVGGMHWCVQLWMDMEEYCKNYYNMERQ